MARMDRRALDGPDEIREIPKGRIEVFTLGGGTVYRATLQPGWRRSESLKEAAGTESCPKDHVLHVLSGRIHVWMDDGIEGEQCPVGTQADLPTLARAASVGPPVERTVSRRNRASPECGEQAFPMRRRPSWEEVGRRGKRGLARGATGSWRLDGPTGI